LVAPVARVAPLVLALDREPEGLATPPQGGQDRFPAHRRAGHDADRRLLGQLHVAVGGDGVDQDPELEALLAEGLDPHAGAAAARVAEAHDDAVALAQEAPHHLDVERLVPGPDVALHVVIGVQHRAVAGLDGDVVGRRRVVELGPPHVAGEAVHDLDRARVVDAEIARRVGQGEGPVRPGLYRPRGLDSGGAHLLRQVLGMGHGSPRRHAAVPAPWFKSGSILHRRHGRCASIAECALAPPSGYQCDTEAGAHRLNIDSISGAGGAPAVAGPGPEQPGIARSGHCHPYTSRVGPHCLADIRGPQPEIADAMAAPSRDRPTNRNDCRAQCEPGSEARWKANCATVLRQLEVPSGTSRVESSAAVKSLGLSRSLIELVGPRRAFAQRWGAKESVPPRMSLWRASLPDCRAPRALGLGSRLDPIEDLSQ
jgi:hypothetical protein